MAPCMSSIADKASFHSNNPRNPPRCNSRRGSLLGDVLLNMPTTRMYMTIATFLKSAAWSELGLGGPSLVLVVRCCYRHCYCYCHCSDAEEYKLTPWIARSTQTQNSKSSHSSSMVAYDSACRVRAGRPSSGLFAQTSYQRIAFWGSQ